MDSTVVITGATSGLGRYLAEHVNGRVVVHGRDAAKVAAVAEEVGAEDTVLADLARLSEVDRMADELSKRFERIDVLVNNAGVGFGAPEAGRAESADGIELRFAVNYLAGYHLTRRLMPARVVNVVSAGQYPIDFDDPMLERGYDRVVAYRRSKLAQVMFTFDLAGERPDIEVNAVHPASHMDTAMVREARAETLSTVEEGGAATLRLIDGVGVSGRFFNGTKQDRANEQAYDPVARARLRELSDGLIRRTLAK